MFNSLFFYFRIIWLLLNRRFVPHSLIDEDYNRLAPTYDEYFSKFVSFASCEVVKRLSIKNSDIAALDLACGTGTITQELSKNSGYTAKITAIDSSEGMLIKAKEKTQQNKNIEFILGDIKNELRRLPEQYFDYVTSGWAIGYSTPLKILEDVKRVLKDGGKLGIIENRINTLSPIRKTAIKVAQRYPFQIRYVMDLPLRLPKSKEDLQKLFLKSGLRPIDVWEGEIKFHFNSGKEVLNWILHTGASAGFDRIMSPEIRDKCDSAFIEFIEKDYLTSEGIDVFHRFVAGVAQKE